MLVELGLPATATVFHNSLSGTGDRAAATAAAVSHLSLVAAEQSTARTRVASAGIPGLREVNIGHDIIGQCPQCRKRQVAGTALRS